MSNDPKTRCHKGCTMSNKQGVGLYNNKGPGKVKGFMRKKGIKWECWGCSTIHIFDNNGHFLGFGE